MNINKYIRLPKEINSQDVLQYFKKWNKLSKSIFSKRKIQKIIEKYNQEVLNFNYNLTDF